MAGTANAGGEDAGGSDNEGGSGGAELGLGGASTSRGGRSGDTGGSVSHAGGRASGGHAGAASEGGAHAGTGNGGRASGGVSGRAEGGSPGGGTSAGGRASGGGAGGSPSAGGTSAAAGGQSAGGAATGGALNCEEETVVAPGDPSTDCTFSDLAFTRESVCGDAETCPITDAHVLACRGSGYGPWIAPTGDSGVSVLFVTTIGGYLGRLFTLEDGATGVVDMPTLSTVTNSLSADSDGAPVIFAGEMPGITRLRSVDGAWRKRRVVRSSDIDTAFLGDAVQRDENHVYAAYFSANDGRPHLVGKKSGCFEDLVLSDDYPISMGLALDDDGAPWVAWWQNHEAGTSSLELRSPDGAVSRPYLAPVLQAMGVWNRPRILPTGISGTSTLPALVAQNTQGIHVVVPDDATGKYREYSLPRTASIESEVPCIAEPSTNNPCGGLTSCQEHRAGIRDGFGVARTASGRVYAAWVEYVTDASYELTTPSACYATDSLLPEDVDGRPSCECGAQLTAASGTATVVLARLGESVVGEESIRRFAFDAGTSTGGVAMGALDMTARGEELVLVANLNTGTDTVLTMLHIDATDLP